MYTRFELVLCLVLLGIMYGLFKGRIDDWSGPPKNDRASERILWSFIDMAYSLNFIDVMLVDAEGVCSPISYYKVGLHHM